MSWQVRWVAFRLYEVFLQYRLYAQVKSSACCAVIFAFSSSQPIDYIDIQPRGDQLLGRLAAQYLDSAVRRRGSRA
jgi:hypothetical protein